MIMRIYLVDLQLYKNLYCSIMQLWSLQEEQVKTRLCLQLILTMYIDIGLLKLENHDISFYESLLW